MHRRALVRAPEVRDTYLQFLRTSVRVTTALPPWTTIGQAHPLLRHHAHGIRGGTLESAALRETF
jgi:hypothetical protein